MMAHSNGETIQVGSSFLARFDDDALAVAFSHELSHTILGHRASFEAAGIRKDSKALSARDRQLIRQAEDEADRLSLVLLANSGYNPAIAPEFWRTQGRNLGQGLFRSNTHARAKARAQAMEAQLANGSSH